MLFTLMKNFMNFLFFKMWTVLDWLGTSLVAQMVKNLPAMQQIWL